MKKIDLSLNFDEIRKRIEIDKSQYKPGEWAKLIGLSKQNISNIHGKAGKYEPSLQYIIAVARATGKPVEWYLYGEKASLRIQEPPDSYDKRKARHCEFCGNMSEEVKELCKKVKEIIESKNIVFASVLKTIIAVFDQYKYEGKEKREPLRKLKQKILTFSK